MQREAETFVALTTINHVIPGTSYVVLVSFKSIIHNVRRTKSLAVISVDSTVIADVFELHGLDLSGR